jgi:hypothetical protein
MIKYILILFISVLSYADSLTSIGQDFQYILAYDSDGTHQTGLTINLSIKRCSDNYWFDFSSSTFKASGWTNKTVALTEDATNHNYFYNWVDQGGDTTTNQYIFHVECTGQFIEDETVIFEELSSSEITEILNRLNRINP